MNECTKHAAECSGVLCHAAVNTLGYEIQHYTDEAGWKGIVVEGCQEAAGWSEKTNTFSTSCTALEFLSGASLNTDYRVYEALELYVKPKRWWLPKWLS